jgi:hypothetical protein
MFQTALALVQTYEPQNVEQFLAMAQGMDTTGGGMQAGAGRPATLEGAGESGVTKRARRQTASTTEART